MVCAGLVYASNQNKTNTKKSYVFKKEFFFGKLNPNSTPGRPYGFPRALPLLATKVAVAS